ncbi:hypothetical protein GCM10027565_23520 [Bordetella tumulicola]
MPQAKAVYAQENVYNLVRFGFMTHRDGRAKRHAFSAAGTYFASFQATVNPTIGSITSDVSLDQPLPILCTWREFASGGL